MDSYSKLLEKASPGLIRAYERCTGVDLDHQLERFVSCKLTLNKIKRDAFWLLISTILPLVFLSIALTIKYPLYRRVFLGASISGFACAAMICLDLVRAFKKTKRAIAEAERHLRAFKDLRETFYSANDFFAKSPEIFDENIVWQKLVAMARKIIEIEDLGSHLKKACIEQLPELSSYLESVNARRWRFSQAFEAQKSLGLNHSKAAIFRQAGFTKGN